MTLNYRVVPFQRWHAAWLCKEGSEAGQWIAPPEQWQMLERTNSWTLLLDADPIGCGGTIEQWPGRHMAWALLNRKAGRHMGSVTRVVLEYLAKVKGRIEMTVRADFEQGHRWARLLGFKVETQRLEAYGPEGEDHVGYVRMNG